MRDIDVSIQGLWRLSISMLVVILIAQLTIGVTTAQEMDANEAAVGDIDLAASLLDGLLQNNRALKSFDVTFDAEYMELRPDNKLTTSHLKVRYCHSDADQGLFVRSRIADQISADQELKSTNTLAAIFLDSTPYATSIDATGRSVLKFQSMADRNQRVGIPGFHSLGYLLFPHVAPFLPPADPYWSGLTVPNDDTAAFIQSPRRAKVVQKRRSGDTVIGISIWMFDMETLLPDKRTNFYIDLAGDPKLKEVEDYTWKAFAGVYVPTRIRAEVKQIAVDEESGARLPYSEIYDSRFDWKSVNTEVPKELFVWKNVTSMKDVQALLNGEAGAARQ